MTLNPPNTVSSVLYLLAELYPDLTADEAEAIATHLMEYVADQETKDAKVVPTYNYWPRPGPSDVQ